MPLCWRVLSNDVMALSDMGAKRGIFPVGHLLEMLTILAPSDNVGSPTA